MYQFLTQFIYLFFHQDMFFYLSLYSTLKPVDTTSLIHVFFGSSHCIYLFSCIGGLPQSTMTLILKVFVACVSVNALDRGTQRALSPHTITWQSSHNSLVIS